MASTSTDIRFGVNTGRALKVPCRAATTANITLSGAQTIDGVSAVANDRILVKNQTDASENGIYVVAAGAWTRAADWDGSYDVQFGTLMSVTSGTVNALTLWYIATSGTITIGTTEVTISQYVVSAFVASGGSGSGVGASADLTDNRIVRADGTTNIQNSGWSCDDSDVVTAGGNLVMNDKVLSQVELKDHGETAYNLTLTGNISIDYTNGQYQYGTMTGNTTVTSLANWPASGIVGAVTLELTQASTTAYTFAVSGAKHAGGSAPTLSTGSSAKDVFVLWSRTAGTSPWLVTSGQAFST